MGQERPVGRGLFVGQGRILEFGAHVHWGRGGSRSGAPALIEVVFWNGLGVGGVELGGLVEVVGGGFPGGLVVFPAVGPHKSHAGMAGGMEHASAIFYGAQSVNMEPSTNLVTHEIAHQWFGDSVTESDWDDVWLSEGFATYLTLLSTEHYRGRDAFVEGLLSARERVGFGGGPGSGGDGGS